MFNVKGCWRRRTWPWSLASLCQKCTRCRLHSRFVRRIPSRSMWRWIRYFVAVPHSIDISVHCTSRGIALNLCFFVFSLFSMLIITGNRPNSRIHQFIGLLFIIWFWRWIHFDFDILWHSRFAVVGFMGFMTFSEYRNGIGMHPEWSRNVPGTHSRTVSLSVANGCDGRWLCEFARWSNCSVVWMDGILWMGFLAKKELHRVLKNDELPFTSPLLIYANKQDRNGALRRDRIEKRLELQTIKTRPWHIAESIALHNEGIEEGIDWLCETLHTQIRNRKNNNR